MSKLVVISAPSGAGKTSIANCLINRIEQLSFSISATSRSPRVDEKGKPIEPCGKMHIKELLARYEIHQVRDVQFDFSKVRDIKELIDAKGGNTDECDPINVLFCQTYPNGAIVNGSHTARAIELSDLAQEAPVAIHTDMSVNGETLDMISNMRNRRPEKIKSDSTLEDLAALLVKNKIASVKFDFEGADALRIMELNNILLASDKKKIKELAVEKWNKYSEGSRPVVRVDYRHPDNKKKAKKQAKNKTALPMDMDVDCLFLIVS